MTHPLLAFAAGLLTVAAPCVLPMLPVVLGSSLGTARRTRPLFIALGFAAAFCGVALVFASFQHLLGLSQQALRDTGALLMLAFGLLMVWPRPFQRLSVLGSAAINRVSGWGERAGSGNLGGLVLGMTLGAVWTPCAGPVLASILAVIATEPTTARTALLLASYSAGAALPMLAIAYGGQFAFTRMRRLVPHTHRLQQAFGVVVAGVALATFFEYDSLATVWLSRFYPQGPLGL
ncbi:MAG: cytochrome c biogenesis CcdA family protein [Pseudomonadota bacterium]